MMMTWITADTWQASIMPAPLADTVSGIIASLTGWLFLVDASAGTCADGLIAPGPPVSPWSTIYTTAMLFYLFYGVSIGADLFMEAIEMITSVPSHEDHPNRHTRTTRTVARTTRTVARTTRTLHPFAASPL